MGVVGVAGAAVTGAAAARRRLVAGRRARR